jgi:integrase
MPKQIAPISAQKVASFTADGTYAVSANLYLRVAGHSRSWVFRFYKGTRHNLGLGPCSLVTLAEARQKVHELRRGLLDGVDPLADRRRKRTEGRIAAAGSKTFHEAAVAYIDAKRAGWTEKHADQIRGFLDYVDKPLGSIPVDQLNTQLVHDALAPKWASKNATMTRVRLRVENVLDFATSVGWRRGDNPARWIGHLEHLLADPGKVHRVEHRAAMTYNEVPGFIAELRKAGDLTAKAIEFDILTATRRDEARLTRWSEVDRAAKTWTIPTERLGKSRTGQPFVVPLSDVVLGLLDRLDDRSEYLFPSPVNRGKPLSVNAKIRALKSRLGRADLTMHGFRSSFRDWAGDMTSFAREVAEQCLNHAIGNRAEQAYRRADALEKRRKLMDAWSRHCDQPTITRHGAEVVSIGIR